MRKRIRGIGDKMLYAVVVAQGFIFQATAFAAGAAGGSGFQSLNESGTEAQTTVQEAIKNWKWVLALLPFALALGLAFLVKMRLDEKEENGQTMPKFQRYAQIVGGFIAGIVISYILYGLTYKTFAGGNFSDGWTKLVTDFWSNALQ